MEKGDKGSTMILMGVSGWMFLLVPAYPFNGLWSGDQRPLNGRRRQCSSFNNMKVYSIYFACSAWKHLLTSPKLGFWRFHPQNREQYQQTSKRHIIVRVHVVWAIPCENLLTDLTCRSGPWKSINKCGYILPVCPENPNFWRTVKRCGFCVGRVFSFTVDKPSLR